MRITIPQTFTFFFLLPKNKRLSANDSPIDLYDLFGAPRENVTIAFLFIFQRRISFEKRGTERRARQCSNPCTSRVALTERNPLHRVLLCGRQTLPPKWNNRLFRRVFFQKSPGPFLKESVSKKKKKQIINCDVDRA